MPAGRGASCDRCYQQQTLDKRIAQDMAAFKDLNSAVRFEQFARWLVAEIGISKAALTLHRYLNFFLALEVTGSLENALALLLQEKKLANLRPQNLPLRFLATKGITLSDQIKKALAEKKRIQTTLDEILDPAYKPLLHTYHAALHSKHHSGITSLTSIRLALRAAANLIQVAIAHHHPTLKQADVALFLQRTPGQRAALFGFITFLRQSQQVNLSLPRATTRNNKIIREKQKKELIAAIADMSCTDRDQCKLIKKALTYFHGVPKQLLSRMKYLDVKLEKSSEGIIVIIKEYRYWLPVEYSKSTTHPLSHTVA